MVDSAPATRASALASPPLPLRLLATRGRGPEQRRPAGFRLEELAEVLPRLRGVRVVAVLTAEQCDVSTDLEQVVPEPVEGEVFVVQRDAGSGGVLVEDRAVAGVEAVEVALRWRDQRRFPVDEQRPGGARHDIV